MRIVIQKVLKASVKVDNNIVGAINNGLLIFAGFEQTDSNEDILWMSNKIVNCRIFNDQNNIMNLSLLQIQGDILLVSQFTLHASTKKGNRPSYSKAAKNEVAIELYQKLVSQLELDLGKKIEQGIFAADMKVELINDGPVTILIDSKNKE